MAKIERYNLTMSMSHEEALRLKEDLESIQTFIGGGNITQSLFYSTKLTLAILKHIMEHGSKVGFYHEEDDEFEELSEEKIDNLLQLYAESHLPLDDPPPG